MRPVICGIARDDCTLAPPSSGNCLLFESVSGEHAKCVTLYAFLSLRGGLSLLHVLGVHFPAVSQRTRRISLCKLRSLLRSKLRPKLRKPCALVFLCSFCKSKKAESAITLLRIQTAPKHKVDNRVRSSDQQNRSYTPKALPTTPRMLELTAEPLNYDKITKFRNLQGPNSRCHRYLLRLENEMSRCPQKSI